MTRGTDQRLAFNRGVVSPRALSRIDLAKNQLSAEIQTNWMPRAMGSMMLRPGLGYVGTLFGKTQLLPFVFSSTDTALLAMRDQAMTVWRGDAMVSRPIVSTVVSNGGFATSVGNWADEDESGATSDWDSATQSMRLRGDGKNFAQRRQLLTVTVGDSTKLHALRLQVQGTIQLRVGTTSTNASLVNNITLKTGVHSIAFIPDSLAVHVTLRSNTRYSSLVNFITIDTPGILNLPTPYAEADLPKLRFTQSGDIVFVACDGYRPMQIERRPNDSWSVVDYLTEDGPFRVENTGSTTISSNALTGDVTLTASQDLFTAPFNGNGHVGSIWSITAQGQFQTRTITGANQWSDPVKVTGVAAARDLPVDRDDTGSLVGRVTVQQSVGREGSWVDFVSWATIGSAFGTINDGLDNQTVYYRIGVKTGDYTSGSGIVKLNYANGRNRGIVRITGVNNPKSATASVLAPLGNTSATDIWAEGLWSDVRGYPSSVAIHDGRLWWAGKDKFLGSVTDGFYSFDSSLEGDAGPINRSIGSGPVDRINWLVSLSRLIAGTDGRIMSCKSTSLDEPLTPTNFNPKKIGTIGTAPVDCAEVDTKAVFVQLSGRRVYELAYSVEQNDYAVSELTQFCPDLLAAGVVKVVSQRQPDTRVHCLLADGTVGVLLYDKAEQLICWVKVETAGQVEDIAVLPGAPEDAVYYVVNRNGVRLLERWAREDQCLGASDSRCLDSHITATNAAFVIPPQHWAGLTVHAYGDGEYIGPRTVNAVEGGVQPIALGKNYSHVCVGLRYEALFKSSRLAAVIDQGGSTFGSRQKIEGVSLVLLNTHIDALEVGQTFDRMDPLPRDYQGEDASGRTFDKYEDRAVSVPGNWQADSRLCIRATTPYACTVTAAAIHMAGNAR